MMKTLARLGWFVGAMVVLLMIVVTLFFWQDTWDPYGGDIDQGVSVPVFQQVALVWEHRYDGEARLPITASSLIDVDGDGVEEVFLGGGHGQDDGLFAYQDGGFVDIGDRLGLSAKGAQLASLGAASVDSDGDGWEELFVAREDGVSWYDNEEGILTAPMLLDLDFADNSNPLSFSFGDIDQDGDLDMFVATYIRRELMDGVTNFSDDYGSWSELFVNQDGTRVQQTDAAGLRYRHNTFQGVLVDVTNDSWLDLVVAYDTGEPRIYVNNQDLTFSLLENPHTGTFSYPMGVGVGDYDNNGWTDLFFSNVGSTMPASLVRGNLADDDVLKLEWFLLRNQGEGVLVEDGARAQIADFEFSWGGVMADMNNDGLQDIIVAENYVDLPQHVLFRLPGRFLLQQSDHTFVASEKKSGVRNPYFGITPLVSDWNQDGALDLIWVNIAGPARAFVSRGGYGNYLQVVMPQDATHIGAKISVTTEGGRVLTDDLVVGEGLAGDQSAVLHFGLGEEQAIGVSVVYPDGTEQAWDGVAVNEQLSLAR